MNIVCFGDSITYAGGLAECDKWPTMLQYKLEEWSFGRFKVYNRGIGGNTTANGMDRFDTDVLPLLPATVLIEFGFNDSNVVDWTRVNRVGVEEYRKNLTEFQRLIKTHKGKTIFIVNHTIARREPAQGNGKSHNTNLRPYNIAVKEVAKRAKAPVIDLPAMMKKRRVDLKKFLTDDGIHLSAEGNHLYAGMVFQALKTIL